jgi:hypothetical protein
VEVGRAKLGGQLDIDVGVRVRGGFLGIQVEGELARGEGRGIIAGRLGKDGQPNAG